jgi:hypothetical protein
MAISHGKTIIELTYASRYRRFMSNPNHKYAGNPAQEGNDAARAEAALIADTTAQAVRLFKQEGFTIDVAVRASMRAMDVPECLQAAITRATTEAVAAGMGPGKVDQQQDDDAAAAVFDALMEGTVTEGDVLDRVDTYLGGVLELDDGAAEDETRSDLEMARVLIQQAMKLTTRARMRR